MRALALAPARAREAQLIDGLEVAAVEHLRSAVRVLSGGPGDPLAEPRDGARRRAGDRAPRAAADASTAADLSDVRGQHHAVRRS